MNMFSALADPTRREILELLASRGELSASEISEKFPVSPQAISQHLKVLREANMVLVEKRGQQRIYRVNPQAMLELEEWARKISQLWTRRLDALEKVVEAEKMKSLKNEQERKSSMASQVKEITITRIFDGPRELVYRAWTDPKLLAQWWGPEDFTNPVCEVDVRPGGAILIHMRGPDGAEYPMKGIYHEVVENQRLVFSSNAFEDEAGNAGLEDLTTVTFADQEGGKTKVTVHAVVTKADPQFAEALAGMEQGWNESLDKLARYLVKA